MADVYSTISLVAFILAGVSLLAAIAVFFTLNVREAYMELRGQTDRDWVAKQQKKRKLTSVKGESKTTPGTDAKTVKNSVSSKYDVEDEAVTVLDSGEEVTEAALIGVYEPGTDVADLINEEKTEIETERDAKMLEVDDECATSVENEISTFKVTRREIYIFGDEIIR